MSERKTIGSSYLPKIKYLKRGPGHPKIGQSYRTDDYHYLNELSINFGNWNPYKYRNSFRVDIFMKGVVTIDDGDREMEDRYFPGTFITSNYSCKVDSESLIFSVMQPDRSHLFERQNSFIFFLVPLRDFEWEIPIQEGIHDLNGLFTTNYIPKNGKQFALDEEIRIYPADEYANELFCSLSFL